MVQLTLDQASIIVDTAIAHARRSGLKPMCIVVLDAGAERRRRTVPVFGRHDPVLVVFR